MDCTPRSVIAATLVLTGVTIAAYLPALGGGFIWDDQEYLVENSVLHEPGGLWRIWAEPSANNEHHYWPMTFTTFWLEHRCWGLRPIGYHLTNVLLHAFNAVLVWLLLRRLRVPGAWVAAAVFALHPVRVESVAWIIERKDVLSGCFYLLAWLAYLRSERVSSRSVYALALTLFVCAMLSKSMAISLPVAIALGLWWKNDQLRVKDLARLAPFAVIGGLLAALDVQLVWSAEPGALGLSPVARVLLAGRALTFYAAKLAWPAPLMAICPRWQIDDADPTAYLYPVGVLLLAIVLWMARRRIGKGPLVAGLFFLVTLGPVLGLVGFTFMKYSYVADRFQYLAAIGPTALVIGAAAQAARRLRTADAWIAYAAVVVLLCGLGALTWKQSRLYRNDEVFWRANLARNPAAWAAHYNLGVAVAQRERPPADVIGHLAAALAIKPDFPEAHNRWGIEEARRDDLPAAIAHFETALRIDPGFADARRNLTKSHADFALEQARLGRLDTALHHFQRALRLDPDVSATRYNFALALAQQHRLDDAIEQLDELLRRNPGDVPARDLRQQLHVARVRTNAGPANQPTP